MHAAILASLMMWGLLAAAPPAWAVLLDKILAVVNDEVLTLQDFETHLALRRIFQRNGITVDRQGAFQRFTDHTLIRQEALRTRIVEIEASQVSGQLQALEARPREWQELLQVMHERGLTQHDVERWLRHQLIVRAFIDRRIRLFTRVSESQIIQYYQQHQQAIGESFGDAVSEQIRRVLVEQQVSGRLAELVGELRRKGILNFPP